MEDENFEELKKDLGEHYNNTIARLLDEVEQTKREIASGEKIKVKHLNFLLHMVFMKISEKVKEQKPKDVTKQEKYNSDLDKYINQSFRKIRVEERGEIIEKIQHSKKRVGVCCKILEDRERHLNKLLEYLGLTATTKKAKKRFR